MFRRRAPTPQTELILPWRLRLFALLLSIIAFVVAWRVIYDLPALQVWRLDHERVQTAFDAANKRMSPEILAAEYGRAGSQAILAAIRDPSTIPQQRNLLRQTMSRVTNSQLPRWQMAALVMLELEHAGTPPEQWWPRVKPYLEGVTPGGSPHFLLELRRRDTELYIEQGLWPGVAARAAAERMGHFHHALLQTLASRVSLMLDAMRALANEESSAAQIESMWRQLLADWVMTPGPEELRMLAADLLANELERSDSEPLGYSSQPSGALAIRPSHAAPALRGWRFFWLQDRRSAPTAAAAFDPLRRTPEASLESGSKVHRYFFLLSATLAALCAGMLLFLPTLFIRVSPFVRSRSHLAEFMPALVPIPVLILNRYSHRVDIREQLAGWGAGSVGVPMYAMLVPLLVLVLAALIAFCLRGHPVQRLAKVALPTCLMLPAFILFDAWKFSRELADYDKGVHSQMSAALQDPLLPDGSSASLIRNLSLHSNE